MASDNQNPIKTGSHLFIKHSIEFKRLSAQLWCEWFLTILTLFWAVGIKNRAETVA